MTRSGNHTHCNLPHWLPDTFHCMYVYVSQVKFNEKSATLNSEMCPRARCIQYVLYLENWYVPRLVLNSENALVCLTC